MEQRIRQIVVGYDFSDGATRAVEAALWLGRRVGAAVRIVTALPGGSGLIDDRDARDLGRDALELETMMVEQVAGLARERLALLDTGSVELAFDVGEKKPDVLLRETCDFHDADMIFVGAVGRTAAEWAPVGTDTFRLIRHSAWPVMVVKRGTPFPPSKILVPVDFSDASERALGWAVDLARLTNAELTVLHVIEGKTTEAEFSEWLELRDLSRVRAVHREVRRGIAYRVIGDVAAEGRFELMAIGSLGRGRVFELLIGGTTERVLRQLPCSMLFLKPQAFVLRS